MAQNVKEQCAAVNKELKNVILFPKEAKALEKSLMTFFNCLFVKLSTFAGDYYEKSIEISSLEFSGFGASHGCQG